MHNWSITQIDSNLYVECVIKIPEGQHVTATYTIPYNESERRSKRLYFLKPLKFEISQHRIVFRDHTNALVTGKAHIPNFLLISVGCES